MSIGVMIVGHGDLGQALVASAALILGEQDNIAAVSLKPQDNLETCQCALTNGIEHLDTSQGVIVLADLFGGTPCNAAALGQRERSYPIVAGANLPMMLEVLLSRDHVTSVDELASIALEAGTKSIIDVGAQLRALRTPPNP
jgi:mannose/fructose/sorbose-specific phosphotransferase system IIA component